MAQTVTLVGLSGRRYLYTLANVNLPWPAVPGNYAFVDRNGNPKYIGETRDFSSRRPGPSHEQWPAAAKQGAQFVIARANPAGESARKAEERDLILAYNPPCNTQHRLGARLLSGEATRPAGSIPRRTLRGGL